MALMTFREGNRVKWVGVRPAHRGEQIVESGNISNDTVIVHTVTAGKILYLVTATFSLSASVANERGSMQVRDTGDVEQYRIFSQHMRVTGSIMAAAHFNPPLEIPAGYDITILSEALTLVTYGFIFGWEEDA